MDILPTQPEPLTTLRVLGGGEDAFRSILAHVEHAESRIEMRAFLWHDDETGNKLGKALLRAAERGVKIFIDKDRIAAVYEHAGGNNQSFFHKRLRGHERFQAWILGAAYRLRGKKGPRPRQRPNPLVVDLLAHPNISVSHGRKRFDHSKVYIFDERTMVLGSMGIGDNHHNDWIDVMVEIECPEHVERLARRMAGEAEFDPSRRVDFLVHSREAHAPKTCSMLTQRLALIDAARESLVIEMAYLGDPRFTAALLRAVRRGVDVTLLTGERANVLGELNRATCARLVRATREPENLRVVLHPQMVHTKLVVVDGRYIDIGSANFTPLSHGVYDEINLYVDDEAFAEELTRLVFEHCLEGSIVGADLKYRKFTSSVERATVAYQSRKGGKLKVSRLGKSKAG
jgi:cardiolipin synthase